MLHNMSKTVQAAYTNVYPFPLKIQDLLGEKRRRKLKFLTNYQEISSKLFSFYLKDTSHDLQCTLLLDIQDIFDSEKICSLDGSLVSMLVGDFPIVDTRLLYEKVAGQAHLKNTITVQFYLNLLKSLLVFSKDQGVQGLIFTFDENSYSAMEVYRQFIVSENVVMTEKGRQTQVVIPTDSGVYTELVAHMEEIDAHFRRTLWRDQRDNATICTYLKSHSLSYQI